MFSLVATLAFGSFAMANNVEVEKTKTIKKTMITKKTSQSGESCTYQARQAFINVLDNGGTPGQANSAYLHTYYACVQRAFR
jgi:hypothetical protein